MLIETDFLSYFAAGSEGMRGTSGMEGNGCPVVFAGAEGADCSGITDEELLPSLFPKKANENEVTINTIAAIVVSLFKKLPGPLLPKIV